MCEGRGFLLLPTCPEDPQMPSSRGHVHNYLYEQYPNVRERRCTEACTHCCLLDGTRREEPQPVRQDWWPSEWTLAEHRTIWTVLSYADYRLHYSKWDMTNIRADGIQLMSRHLRGYITTDVQVGGICTNTNTPAKIPPRLVGLPIDTDPLTVRYEWYGSFLEIEIYPWEESHFRFAHPWDKEDGLFSTHELL